MLLWSSTQTTILIIYMNGIIQTLIFYLEECNQASYTFHKGVPLVEQVPQGRGEEGDQGELQQDEEQGGMNMLA